MSNELITLTDPSNPDNKAYKIQIYSFSNEEREPIEFPAFLKDFTDSYKSEWNAQKVLGKMDPIATFKNTTRTIALSFDIPSDSVEAAKENLNKIDYIIRGQYPVYDSGVLGTAVLSSPPYFRVRFSNLVRNAGVENDGGANTLRSGLLCYFTGFDFKPNSSSGFFIENGDLYPKLIEVSLSLNVIHEHPLGKKETNGVLQSRDGFKKFPRLDEAAAKKQEALTSTAAPTSNNSVAQNDGKQEKVLG